MKWLIQPVSGESRTGDHMFRFLISAYKVTEQFPRLPSLLTPMASPGIPTTTLSSRIHKKDSQNLLKPIVLTVMIYYSECIQIKISQGKRHIGWGSGEFHTYTKPPAVLSQQSHGQKQCTTICMEYCQPGKFTQAMVCCFYRGLISRTWSAAHMADLSLQSIPELS